MIGQKLFVGLFTAQSYTRPLETIPLLRSKLQTVIDRAGFAPESHDGKALRHILDSFPHDELFQFDDEALFETAIGILGLQERQRIALFLRHDPYGRFVSCLVYVPKDRYSASVRDDMAAVLVEAFGGRLASEATHLDESALARLHFVIAAPRGRHRAGGRCGRARAAADRGGADMGRPARGCARPRARAARRASGCWPGIGTRSRAAMPNALTRPRRSATSR